MSQINSSFGSGGMSLAMNDLQFAALLLYLKSNSECTGTSIRKAACVIGQQPCGNVWVMGKDLQVGTLYCSLVDLCGCGRACVHVCMCGVPAGQV